MLLASAAADSVSTTVKTQVADSVSYLDKLIDFLWIMVLALLLRLLYF